MDLIRRTPVWRITVILMNVLLQSVLILDFKTNIMNKANNFIKSGLLLAVGILVFASCDVMDTKPKASFSEEMVWGSENTADAYAINCYRSVIGYFTGSADMESLTPNGDRKSTRLNSSHANISY